MVYDNNEGPIYSMVAGKPCCGSGSPDCANYYWFIWGDVGYNGMYGLTYRPQYGAYGAPVYITKGDSNYKGGPMTQAAASNAISAAASNGLLGGGREETQTQIVCSDTPL